MNEAGRHEEEIEMAAVAWVVRLGAGPLDEAEQRSLDGWLRDDKAHETAFRRAHETWADLGQIGKTLILEKRRASRPAPLHWRALSRRRAWQALAASVILAACLGGLYAGDPVTALRADYRTRPGETRIVALPDGSTARLNTDSAIAVRFGADRREIELLSGEAAFAVAKTVDGRRPFIVRANEVSSRALGTRFAVRREDDAVEVTVLAHRVEVTVEDPAAEPQTIVLDPARAVRYSRAAGLGPVRQTDTDRTVAWLHGRLVFDGVPLAEAVAELNRYRRGRIVIMDSALAGRRVSGVFRLDNLDTAIDVIAGALGARTAAVPFATFLY